VEQLLAEVASLRTENAALKAQLEQRTRDAKRLSKTAELM
jgi:hypothetical protein